MPNKQHSTTITLPRGTLDLTYQTNSATAKDGTKPSNHYQLEDLLGFAQRINPKRAFLFVSKVLGRHIPVAPSTMRHAFTDLANLVPDDLPEPILVIGMAETAVGLSAGVHQALQTRYPNALLLNSTRHAQHNEDNTETLLTTFSEDHSHASQHLIYQSADKAIQAQLLVSKTLIMVDDEASTGNTCVNVVTALRNAGLTELEQVQAKLKQAETDRDAAQAELKKFKADKREEDIKTLETVMNKQFSAEEKKSYTDMDDTSFAFMSQQLKQFSAGNQQPPTGQPQQQQIPPQFAHLFTHQATGDQGGQQGQGGEQGTALDQAFSKFAASQEQK